MPLVTRTAVGGSIFKQETEPPDWLSGDMWVIPSTGVTAVNSGGTAIEISAGTLNQGDTLFSDTDENLATLAKGTATQILAMNSGATAPEWVTSPAVTISTQSVVQATSFTTTSTSFVDITSQTITLPNNTGKSLCNVSYVIELSSTAENMTVQFLDASTAVTPLNFEPDFVGREPFAMSMVADNDGQTVKTQMKVTGATGKLWGTSEEATTASKIETLEIA